MNRSELTLFSNHAHAAGFRLERFEAYNWGPFHEKVCTLPLFGENALLTGANGAGKTTLVDALIALLNPTPERYFNQSAGFEDRKRTRRVEDYVRGVYGQSQNGREQLRDLPDQAPTYTVLLGVFYNDDLKQHYTLAHLYWFKNGELQKRFYTAPAALNIEEHFRFGGDIRAFNAHLTKTLQARMYDGFQEFALDFQPKLGMRQPEKAGNAAGRTKPLHLLAKTAGIKVLGNLDSFIREHMLDEANMEEQFDLLKKEYADIAETQQTLEKLSRQEQMLMPLLAHNTTRLRLMADLRRLETLQTAIGPWFATRHAALLEAELKRLANELERKQSDLADADRALEQLQKEKTDIEMAIAQSDEGRQMRELQAEKQREENRLADQRKQAERYAAIARSLDLVPEPDAALFFAQKGQLDALRDQFLAKKTTLEQLRDDLVGQKHDKEKAVAELNSELESLRGRRNNLPRDLVECRERLASAIGAAAGDLPFVGELLQVRASERDVWEYALEKLVRPFSLHLLVPQRHLRAVVRWVRQNKIGTFLRFVEADDDAGEALSNNRSQSVAANKLEVHPQSPFANWLQNELNKRYPHHCTEDNAEYERQPKALTPEGLYKSDKQHQKDDRPQRHSAVMGWDNADKIRKLGEELRDAQNALRQLDERMAPVAREMAQLDQKMADLQRLRDFSDFKTIDFKQTLERLETIIADLETLSSASSQMKMLEQRQKKVDQDIKAASARRDTLIRDESALKSKAEQRATQLRFRTDDAAQPILPSVSAHLAEYLRDLPDLELDTLEKIEQEQARVLARQLAEAKGQLAALEHDIEKLLLEFKQPKKALLDQFPTWPNDTDALGGPILGNIGDYLALLERIQTDQLPILRERYQARASKDIGNAMQAFQRRLEDQLNDHRENIRNINRSLRALPYSHDTYLQVVLEDHSRKGRIGEFYQLLKSWDYDRAAFHAASEVEKLDIWRETVQRIGAIIRRLEQNEVWRKDVTDVRNWLSFKTQQYYQENDTAVGGTLLDGTGGKSGGEQAKLTYTVLAAALTYQFNISADERNARSFRFIAVDEAFSKLDPENSAYLLDLLSKLKFQMLIITPNTGVATGEQYMSHLIFVKKESELPPRSVAYCYSIKALKKQVGA